MKVAVITKTKAPVVFEERPLPKPGPGEIRIKVAACGVCHSDLHIWEGHFDFAKLPIVPGHEVAGVVDQLGPGVTEWKVGERVGMPWIYSTCGHCDACVAGDDPGCARQEATGVSKDGGYAPYMIAPAAFATRIPEALDLAEAAPLFCAGLTVYGALREADIRGGMTVAVQGLGGLGQLGVQYARALGARVLAVTRSADKTDLARRLGAAEVIVARDGHPGEALARRGGADIILTTVHVTSAITPLLAGLAPRGSLVMVGAAGEPLPVNPLQLMVGRARVLGSVVGNRKQMREVLDLAVRHDIRPVIERHRLEDVSRIFEKLGRGEQPARAVLTFE
ncbi:MAG TPA: alcohol dehydrogenase catalytic domain-containing protein [Phycisphaerae bacterium]|nr:alcohol dehydrogenase catalytic domain-containing protein [Phycisphaerae bacterium]HNU46365.1 alcohol dehydrogenase catalytic domain-containing protein [Phycisphaerae bacterium]